MQGDNERKLEKTSGEFDLQRTEESKSASFFEKMKTDMIFHRSAFEQLCPLLVAD